MTKDEILSMAKECDLVAGNADHGIYIMALERFAALVAEKEREACAKEAHSATDFLHEEGDMILKEIIVQAIRARGSK